MKIELPGTSALTACHGEVEWLHGEDSPCAFAFPSEEVSSAPEARVHHLRIDRHRSPGWQEGSTGSPGDDPPPAGPSAMVVVRGGEVVDVRSRPRRQFTIVAKRHAPRGPDRRVPLTVTMGNEVLAVLTWLARPRRPDPVEPFGAVRSRKKGRSHRTEAEACTDFSHAILRAGNDQTAGARRAPSVAWEVPVAEWQSGAAT